MAGKSKHAEKLAKHLGEPVDAACAVLPTGGVAGQVGANVGGGIGAAISTAAGRGDKDAGDEQIKVDGNCWLGVGPTGFTMTKGDKLWGKPKGDPVLRADYADVASATLTEGKLTMRADVALTDGRTLAFEARRIGPANKPNVEVLELLKQRCGG